MTFITEKLDVNTSNVLKGYHRSSVDSALVIANDLLNIEIARSMHPVVYRRQYGVNDYIFTVERDGREYAVIRVREEI